MTINPWIKTTLLAGIGGAIASSFAALMDPEKYRFPHDLGSGKMWEFFIQGFVVTGGALLIKSPFGQNMLNAFKVSQQQLKESKEQVEQLRTELHESTKANQS